jgi:hypothetical protein
MRIEKIENSNLLQRGQLLAVAKRWRFSISGMESDQFCFIAIAMSRFRGFGGRRTEDCSATLERRVSGGLIRIHLKKMCRLQVLREAKIR